MLEGVVTVKTKIADYVFYKPDTRISGDGDYIRF